MNNRKYSSPCSSISYLMKTISMQSPEHVASFHSTDNNLGSYRFPLKNHKGNHEKLHSQMFISSTMAVLSHLPWLSFLLGKIFDFSHRKNTVLRLGDHYLMVIRQS